jgi:hypothetical protein
MKYAVGLSVTPSNFCLIENIIRDSHQYFYLHTKDFTETNKVAWKVKHKMDSSVTLHLPLQRQTARFLQETN